MCKANRVDHGMVIALLALSAAVPAGCYRPEPAPTMVPVYRFADADWRSKAETNPAVPVRAEQDEIHTAAYPVASIDDEVRYTLDDKVRVPLYYAPRQPLGADGTLKLALAAPPPLREGDRVAIETDLSVDGLRERRPPAVMVVGTKDGKPAITFEPSLPADSRAKKIGVGLHATRIAAGTAFFHRTPPVTVPRAAYLDFAIGIERPAWGQGPVEFRVRACAGQECEDVFREVLDPDIAEETDWQNRRIELGRLAGREVAFSFESRLLSGRKGAFSLPVWGDPTVYAPAARPDRAPNIILISLDTLSARHLPTYGYEFATAPFLDGVLARQGTVFERVVAAATVTPPSHMSMFTSLQPCQHGLTTGNERVRAGVVTLAEVLRAAGYETGAVTEDGWLGYEHGFGHGFNFYAENKSPDVMTPEGQFELTLAKARAWLVRNADKRFFLFVHTFQVHEPYNPPERYRDLFRVRDGVEIGPDSPRRLRESVAYDQEIRYTDDLLRGFFDFLRERALLDNLVVIITSDHGEEFLEHGLQGHGRNLYEEVTHVPLILWGPGRIPAGERDSETVGHIDYMPTILGLAGVETPPQASGRDILAPASTQTPDSADVRFTESHVDAAIDEDYERISVLPPAYLIQQGNRKMARYREEDGFRYEAYDLAADPKEQHDLLPVAAAQFEPMKRLLDGYETACAERLEQSRTEQAPEPIQMDQEREEKLRALGYLQ